MPLSELTGTIVPLVTPFDADESFDAQAMRRLVDYVLEQGADALMPTALTGEGPLLTADETLAIWDVVFEQANEQLPVVPAVVSTTTRKAIRLVRAAERHGTRAVMAAPILPELYAGRAHDDVYAFYADIAAATSLPIILFNYPSLTGVDFVPPLVERLVQIENVQYIKESTGDTRRVHGIQRLVGERISVICGAPNVALESLALGCRAWITGIMNVVPRSAQQLTRAVVELGDLGLARRIYYSQILPVVDMLLHNYNPTGTIKAGVCARGVGVGVPRRPGHTVASGDREILNTLLAAIVRAEAEIATEIAAS
jgi:4-hydroxy-tetrahydrodipicolinate synthase